MLLTELPRLELRPVVKRTTSVQIQLDAWGFEFQHSLTEYCYREYLERELHCRRVKQFLAAMTAQVHTSYAKDEVAGVRHWALARPRAAMPSVCRTEKLPEDLDPVFTKWSTGAEQSAPETVASVPSTISSSPVPLGHQTDFHAWIGNRAPASLAARGFLCGPLAQPAYRRKASHPIHRGVMLGT